VVIGGHQDADQGSGHTGHVRADLRADRTMMRISLTFVTKDTRTMRIKLACDTLIFSIFPGIPLTTH